MPPPVLSLLDRLLDDTPEQATESTPFNAMDLHRARQAMARDLETLLNTRACFPAPEALVSYPRSQSSMLTFGVRDFCGLSMKNPDDQQKLRQDLAASIVRHESRLTDVKVNLDADRTGHRMLHFRVEAVLKSHPHQPTLTFDATLQVASGICQVRS